MKNETVLSLCIPTNGMLEWVSRSLESIYSIDTNYNKFEVIITDNGQNSLFEQEMKNFSRKHENFRYYKTEAYMFLNQIEAFKLAKGELIKFVNHRFVMLPGAVDYMVEYAERNIENKPITYFSNGVLSLPNKANEYDTFDKYVKALSYWSSWSAGTSVWKSEFDKIDLGKEFNRLFPHTDLIFFNKSAENYVVDNTILMREISDDTTQKGRYDLFEAFAVEYPSIIKRLFEEKYISESTYAHVINDNGKFVNKLYYDYVVQKIPCSYDLSGVEKSIGFFYSRKDICGRRVYNSFKHILSGAERIIEKYVKK